MNRNRTVKSYCRLCSGLCGVQLQLDPAGSIVDIRGDKDHPLTRGYACIKGLQAKHIHYDSSRLRHSLARGGDGNLHPIGVEAALDEVSARLRGLIEKYGPRCVALYRGTHSWFNSSGFALSEAWLRSIGSDSAYTTATIDQSSRFVSAGRQGTWEAGLQSIEESDVWMAAGFNPLVSVQGLMGFFPVNPNKEMQRLRAKGIKFIVIDPRRTETARYADIHLQIYPGEDVTLAAGLLHVILNEGWHDAAFCDEHVDGLAALKQAVAPFTPSYVAERAGIEASQLIQAAGLFAHQSRRGFVTYCTGPNMVHRSTLAAQLYDSINIVCGRFRRDGEPVHNPGVLTPRQRLRAQVIPPQRPWNQGPRSRVGEYHGFFGQMMTNTLSEEILRPGPGRIRALVVLGGNPLAALPDRLKAERALRDLELLVVLDPRLSGTAKLADYVIAPKVLYEREDMTNLVETSLFPVPFTQYSAPAAEPPANSEVVDDWYVFWSLARRMGKSLTLNGNTVRMDSVPTTFELLKLLAAGSQVPIAEIASHSSGAVFSVQPQFVEPADAEAGRFSLLDAQVRAQMSEVAAESIVHGAYTECGITFTHRLCVRRMREVINSYLHDAPAIRKRLAFNPAWIHPADAKSLGLNEGDAVTLIGSQGTLSANLEFDDTVRPGSVAISHCWGDAEDGGASTNLLTSTDQFIEPINAMARMTGIPVNIVPVQKLQNGLRPGPASDVAVSGR